MNDQAKGHDTMNPEHKAACLEAIREMKCVSAAFYYGAQKTNVHTFLEFNGFIVEYIKMLEARVELGADIFVEALTAKPHQMEYVAEKIDCIFGDALRDPENRKAFLQTLASKGEWQPFSDHPVERTETSPPASDLR